MFLCLRAGGGDYGGGRRGSLRFISLSQPRCCVLCVVVRKNTSTWQNLDRPDCIDRLTIVAQVWKGDICIISAMENCSELLVTHPMEP